MTTSQLTDYTITALPFVYLRRNNTGRRGNYLYGLRDWPDLIGYDIKGRFWAVEIKNAATRDKMRGRQEVEMERMRVHGCVATVVRTPEDADRLRDLYGGVR